MTNLFKKFALISITLGAFALTANVQAGHHEKGEMKDKMKSEMKDEMKKAKKMDIVDTAVAAGSFNTLAEALTAAELIDTLKGDGPFTVFAPTDDAFAKIPADQLNAILADKELLTSILTYHVVAGKVMAADVVKLDSATTLNGGDVSIATDDGVMINNAKVVKTDIKTSNGVIHVIDTVLIPE